MTWYRKNPLFGFALTLGAVLALVELWFIYERFTASREVTVRLEQRRTGLREMADLTPPPTREVAAAIEVDLARARHAVAAMQGELKGRGPAAERLRTAKVPAARTDAYFDLATFVEKTRELARKQEVEVRPEAARFGFGVFANEGPETEHIEPVFRQRLVAQYLIESLLEARPRALLQVKREPALTRKEREERDVALAAAAAAGTPADAVAGVAPEGSDYFAMDPRVSARVPGYVDTTAFRIAFSGQTASLRAFLNRLASFELPVLVREVEVEPATADETAAVQPAEEAGAAEALPAAPSVVLSTASAVAKAAPKKAGARATTAAPIVAKPVSKFTVTVEYIELVLPVADSPDAPTPAAAPTT
ncbi:MAG: hypothetical protein HY736_03265 [Verrucomicrobia bacterium]|nr:hypothetical protein [Verrucomicrobiota bacterium]